MRRFLSPVLLAAIVYVLLTVALTWPLTIHPASLVPNDLGDPLLNTWILAWNARVLPLTASWWNGPQFYPVTGTLAFSEHLLGLTIFTTPIIWLTGEPLVAHNVAFFLSFVLSALAAYFLAYTISRRHDCAFLAGVAFAFAPYRMAQFAHVQVLSAYWMPVALAALHRYFENRRLHWLVVFAVAWFLQALACGYYLFYLSVLIGLWLLWFAKGPDRTRALAYVAISWAIVTAMLAPVLYGYWRFHHAYGLRRGIDEIISFSADVGSVLKAPDNLWLWGWLSVVKHPEADIFPGLTVVTLIVLGLALGWQEAAKARIGRLRIARVLVAFAVLFSFIAASPLYFGPWKLQIGGLRLLSVGTPHKPLSLAFACLIVAGAMHPSVRTAWSRRSAMTFYALAALAMWLLSLGPEPTLMDHPIIYKAPYAWLMMLPGVEGVRVPARFWMLAALCLSVAAALALRQLTARWPRFARAIPAIACVGILADGWPRPMFMEKRPASRPVHSRVVARLDLPPVASHDSISLFRATEHKRPLFNGYSGYFAPHYWAMQYMIKQHDPAVLTRLSSYGPFEVVVDHDWDPGAALRRFLLSAPQTSLVYRDDRYSAFRVERGPYTPAIPRPQGQALAIASITATCGETHAREMVDGDIMSRWHCGREQRPGDTFTVDLGSERQLAGAELLIAGFVGDFPRKLSIETSGDGATWALAWTGDAALVTMSAALEDPLNIPIPFSFEKRPARYVRFTQLGTEETYYWSVAELRLVGG
ncbi:MAG TPA: discoidin domain-containing protein [Vicinamibacterales bacterium]|jgi:F5/8 type C domain-containing protein|nr:discoidin domain-containing protein [Vicinamibacterales bacterium]